MPELVKIVLDAENRASGSVKQVEKELGGLGAIAGGALKVGLMAGAAAAGAMTAAIGLMVKGAMESELVVAQLDAVIRSTAKAASDWAAADAVKVTGTRESAESIAAMRAELDKLTMAYDLDGAQLQEQKQRLYELTAAWGADALNVKTATAALKIAEAEHAAMGGSITDLQNRIAAGSQVVTRSQAEMLNMVKPALQMTRDELMAYADAMSQVTRFDDEAVISAESVMLTFTQVGRDVFPEAMEAAMDLATRMGTDLKSGIVQVGKALQDPAGVTALKKMGVSFSEVQVEAMKSMFEMGDVAGYQKIVLKELATEFGGSARAAGQTFAGQLDILRNSLMNVAEDAGAELLPTLKELTGGMMDLVKSPGFKGLTQDLVRGVTGGVTALKGIGAAVAAGGARAGAGAALSMGLTAGMLTPAQAGAIAGAVDMIAGAVEKLGAAWTAVSPLIGAAVDVVLAGVMQLLPLLGNSLNIITGLAGQIGGILVQALNLLGSWWATNGGTIIAAVQTLFGKLAEGVTAAQNTLGVMLSGVLTSVSVWFTANEPLIRAFLDTLAQGFLYIVNNVVQAIISAMNGLLPIIGPVIQTIVDTVLGLVTFVMQLITGDWSGAWATAAKVVTNLLTTIISTVNSILKWLGDQVPRFENIGKDLIQGLINGISGMTDALIKAAADGIGAVISAIKKLLGLGSPSRVMFDVGLMTMAGLTGGIQAGLSGVRGALTGAALSMPGLAVPALAYAAPAPAGAMVGGPGVTVVYSPTISLATEDEVLDRLIPLLRRAGVTV